MGDVLSWVLVRSWWDGGSALWHEEREVGGEVERGHSESFPIGMYAELGGGLPIG